MSQSTVRPASAETTQAVERLVESQEFAFAEVAPDGRIHAVNPFGRLCWEWEERQPLPEDVHMALEGLPVDGSEVLPIQHGGLTLTGIRRGTAGGWVIVGYEPPPPAGHVLDQGAFDDLVGRMPVAALRMAADGVVVYGNAAVSEETGYEIDEIRASRFWQRTLLPAHVEPFENALRDAARRGSARVDVAFRAASGVVREGTFFLYRGEGYHIEGVLIPGPETAASPVDARAATLIAVVEQGADGIALLDGDGVVRYANHRIRELLGIAQIESWLSRQIGDAPGIDPALAEAVTLCLQTRKARPVDAQFVSSAGRECVLSTTVIPLTVDGQPAGCAVQFRAPATTERPEDPTARFQEAAAMLREVAATSPDLGIVLDAACRIVGEAARADRVRVVVPSVAGSAASIAWSTDTLVDPTPEQDREIRFVIADRDLLYIGPDPETDGHMLAKMLPIEEALWIRLPAVHPDAFLAIERLPLRIEPRHAWTGRDRAQIRKIVETADVLCSWFGLDVRYRGLVDLVEDATFECVVSDAGERQFSRMAGQIEAVTGVPADRWLSGSAPGWVAGLVQEEDRPAVRAHDHVLQQGVSSSATYRIVRADGSLRWVAERARPVAVPGGGTGFVAVLRDVTERREQEDRLAEALATAENLARRQTAFVATLSHEVRTPIGAIQGYAELLTRELDELQARGGDVPVALREFVTSIEDRARRLTSLVQDLFDLSSIELGHAAVQRVPVPVHDTVSLCASKQAARLREKGLTIRLQLDSRDPKVLSDPRRLEQVFDGLLSNAVKFTETGTITVRTRAAKREVVVEVEDTGIGITPEFQHRIFQAFTQEEDWRNRRYDGTGLGLSLVKRLLDLLGGRIEVESRKEVGSIFRVYLPTVRGPVTRGAVMPRAERG